MENGCVGVRNQGKYKDMTDLFTAKQWEKQGKKIKDDAKGMRLYCNRYCQNYNQYYEPHEVRDMTDEELENYRTREKEKRKTSREKSELRKWQRMEEDIENLCETKYRYLLDGCEEKISKMESAMKSACFALSSLLNGLPIVPCDNPTGVIVLDTETTGLKVADEIIQLSILDGNGKVLFNEYIKPCYHVEWEQAEYITSISPDMVKDKEYLFKHLPVLKGIFASAKTIVGYNTWFDLDKLGSWRIRNDDAEIVDVMQLFAPVYGERNYNGEYEYKSLSCCAEYFGYKFKAHDSLEDAKATFYCWNKLKQVKAKGKKNKLHQENSQRR